MTLQGRLLLVDIAAEIIEHTYLRFHKEGISTEFHVSMLAFFCSALRLGTEKQSKIGHFTLPLYQRILEMESMQRTHKDFAQTKLVDMPVEKAAGFMAFRKPALERQCRLAQHLKLQAESTQPDGSLRQHIALFYVM